MKQNEFAALWRQKTSQPQTVEREFAGLPGIARRLSLTGWAHAGKLPQFLVEQLLGTRGDKDIQIKSTDVSIEDFKALMKAQQDITCYVLEAPRVVVEDRELQEGEVSYTDILMNRPEVITEIMTWVRAGCPDVPVATTDGKGTTVEAVSNFREVGARGAASGTGGDVQAVQPASE